MSDEEEFKMMVGHVRGISEPFLAQWFGERCPDFDEDCKACKRWKALDELTQNPWE